MSHKVKREVWAECPACQMVKLSDEQYDAQLSKPDNKWICPDCFNEARFEGVFWECLQCRTMIPEEEDICFHCGQSQSEAWTALFGDDNQREDTTQ